MEARGNLRDPSLAQPEGAEAGATRQIRRRRGWRSEEAGRPVESPPPAAPKDGKRGATRAIHRRHSRKVGKPGQPGGNTGSEAGKRGRGATREIAAGIAKDERREATRRSIAGTAEGRTPRGNPWSVPPDEPKDAAEGQPETARTAGPEDAGRRGNSNPDHKAGWDDRRSDELQGHPENARDSGLWRFQFARSFSCLARSFSDLAASPALGSPSTGHLARWGRPGPS